MNRNNQRVFQLPGIDELSREQEEAIDLPISGRHLVVGGPGTGKTVVALLRARLFQQRKRIDHIFLVYNKLLERASRQLHPQVNSGRWISWFNGVYKDLTGEYPPRHPGSDWGDIIWEEVENEIIDRDAMNHLAGKSIIIDEGQDMPPGFYNALRLLGAQSIFVAADQNQQIGERNSSIEDIRTALDIELDDVLYLTENFRQKEQGYAIARLAREFHTDPASPPPELPPEPMAQSPDLPLLYAHSAERMDNIMRKILVRIENRQDRLVGIITDKDDDRISWLKKAWEVQEKNSGLDAIPVKTYFSTMDEPLIEKINFNQGGILVINAASCKGLEFDEVFIVDLQNFRADAADIDIAKKRFYVMISRARERLFMLRDKAKDCPVLQLMPNDPKILRREPQS